MSVAVIAIRLRGEETSNVKVDWLTVIFLLLGFKLKLSNRFHEKHNTGGGVGRSSAA